jgi:signal transduction histidine kinase
MGQHRLPGPQWPRREHRQLQPDITRHRAADVALAETSNAFARPSMPSSRIRYLRRGHASSHQRLRPSRGRQHGVPEPLGKRDEEVFSAGHRGLPAASERAYATRQPQQFEWTSASRAGIRALIIHYVPLLDEVGRVRQVLGIVHDITARKQAEEALRQAQKLEAVGRLAGGVAHDFNNIITAVLARATELQADATLGAAARAELADIEQDALRAAALTRQLLLFSRRQVAQMKPLEVNQLLVNLLRMLYRVLGEHIRLDFSADPMRSGSPPDRHVRPSGDGCPERAGRRLRNWAAHPPTRRVTLDSASAPPARPSPFVRVPHGGNTSAVWIRDHPQIFEPFFTCKDIGQAPGS